MRPLPPKRKSDGLSSSCRKRQKLEKDGAFAALRVSGKTSNRIGPYIIGKCRASETVNDMHCSAEFLFFGSIINDYAGRVPEQSCRFSKGVV